MVGFAVLTACEAESAAETLPQGSGYDFHVLSLSWSPSYCAAEGEDANRRQCGGSRNYAFVVHGLWPQFESGWPEFCDSTEPERVPDDLVDTLLDIIPSAGLIGHQWRKHGSCSGLSQIDYFTLVRAARERISIPDRFGRLDEYLSVAPREVEDAFLDANPGLPEDGIAVSCDDRLLREIRVCMTKSLEFRSCEEIEARSCRLSKAVMPPTR